MISSSYLDSADFPVSDKKKKKKARRKRFFLSLCIVAIAALIAVNFVLMQELLKNSQTTRNDLELVFNSLQQIIDSNRNVHNVLELESNTFELDLEPKSNAEDVGEDDTFLLLVDELYQNFYDEQNSIALFHFIQAVDLEKKVGALGFTLEQNSTSVALKYKNFIVATIQPIFAPGSSDIEKFSVASTLVETKFLRNNSKELDILLRGIKKNIETHLAQADIFLQHMARTLASDKMRGFVRELGITVEARQQGEFLHSWKFNTVVNEVVVNILFNALHYRLSINGEAYSEEANPVARAKKVTDTVYSSSYLPKQERANQAYLVTLQTLFATTALRKALSEQDLVISKNWKSNADYYYFDLKTTPENITPGLKIGSIALQKSSGQLWILDKDDVPLRAASLRINTEERKYTVQKSAKTKNILLVGTHNNLADTIILANINPEHGIKLLSLPRDIYYSGNKINWYYKFFTRKNFIKIVEKITGMQIDYYVTVDMYAFITVIDKIGGITVYLEEDLIDPSYKIKENGQWTYVNYSQGEYHLNGIEALRIARSRNTTSDFSRAKRQQLILEAIRRKINSLDSFSSMLSLIQILSDIKMYISTNLKIFEIASLITEHKNASLSAKLTLSTANVLYNTYTVLHNANISLEEYRASLTEESKKEYLGAYILLPHNNDWNALKKYIEQYFMP